MTAASTPVTWTFGSGTLLNDGQAWSLTQSGVTLTVTSWHLPTANSLFQNASTGRWSPGMGVCNDAEMASGCPNSAHTVDNSGGFDLMLFQFDRAVDPASLFVNTYVTGDSDMTMWLGNTSNSTTLLNGASVATLGGLGFAGAMQSNTSGTGSRTVAIGGPTSVNALLVAASLTDTATSDYFKVRSLTVDAAVPEPGTLALIGAALAGMGLIRRALP